MAAKQVKYYDYDRSEKVECRCGWSGQPGAYEDYFHELLDVTCPRCDRMLLIVPYPTRAETEEAAAAGNEEAIAELKRTEERETNAQEDEA
ncbi:MAG TPA: hypothetical protein PKA65_12800 [Solirubrobacterales bacterium]|nr:hypothetical protein [Solirubrobacterales bacterium]